MIRKNIVLLCVLCISTHPAFATEADFEKRMARGVSALDAGDGTRAQEEFRAAAKEHPDDLEVALYLAIALNRSDDPAAESALKTALRLDPVNPRINLELGTFYYNHKMYDESGDYFENILVMKPDPEMRKAAETYLTNIRNRGGGKRWGVSITAGMQYDSNVPLAANKAQLPVGSNRMDDLRGVVNLGLNGVAYRDTVQELSGSYSLYQTLHLHLTDFNLTQNLFDVSYTRRFSPNLSAKVSGDFESILLGGKSFVQDFSVTPGVLVTLNERIKIGFDYRVRASLFTNSNTYPSNKDRDGVTHTIILNYRMPLSETLNLHGGYTFDRELTRVSAWSSSSHRGTVGVGVMLPYALFFDVSGDIGAKSYDETLAPATEPRSDTTVSGASSLSWQASEKYCVSMGYHYTNSDSNISGYEYSRGITSIMIQGRY